MRSNARRHLVAIALLLVGIGLTYAARRARPVDVIYHPDFDAIPLQIGELEGRPMATDEEVRQYLEAELMHTIAYGDQPREVIANVIYGTSWRSVHSPAQCYPASGWHVAWQRPITLPPAGDAPHEEPITAELMRVDRGGESLLVLFVFAHKGGTSTDYVSHSLAVATGPPGAGGLSLMLSTRLLEEEEQARERLIEVASGIYPHAVAFWYKDWEPSQSPGS
ncbi:MAG: exosortase-associated EpsI family protein [candidate division WS1 bacterium]|jgi:hypothetical protein|nr:exosortase-associated EpsI family protein [candidate division WS1 bacterium]